MKKAEITIYLTLVFTLILSVFLSAFEAARGNHLKIRMENAVQTAIHSAFGEYHRELFERYGLLFVDTSYMTQVPDYHKVESRISEYLEYNLYPEREQSLLFAKDWYEVTDYKVTLTNIRLATDDKGNVLKTQAIDYIQNYVGGDWLENVNGWINIIEEYDINAETFQEEHEIVRQEINEKWTQNNLLGETWIVNQGLPSLDFHNEYMDILTPSASFLGDSTISVKMINPLELVSNRTTLQGTGDLENNESMVLEEMYFNEYIIHKLGSYLDVREDCALDYQVEYVLFGLGQDSLNYMKMQEMLFWFRGAANLSMLLSDDLTQEWIKEVSELGTLVKIPPKVIQAVINVCWAAAESADDVRRLLKGEAVVLLKEPKDFAVDIGGLVTGVWMFGDIGTQVSNAESVALEYKDYLRIFLYLMLPETKLYRCMDMIEADIRQTEGNAHFRLDGCMDAASMEIGVSNDYGYFYTMERKYSYF